MKIVNDWEREPLHFLGISMQEGVRGQSVHLNKREIATLRNAHKILEQLRAATDPNRNGEFGEYTPVTEAVQWAEAVLYDLMDTFKGGVFRVDQWCIEGRAEELAEREKNEEYG